MYLYEKERLLNRYLEITSEMEELLLEGEVEEIEALLLSREALIAEITELDFGVSQEMLKDTHVQLDRLFHQLGRKEEQVARLMQAKSREIAEHIKVLNMQKKANQLYQGKTTYSSEGYFFDTTLKHKE